MNQQLCGAPLASLGLVLLLGLAPMLTGCSGDDAKPERKDLFAPQGDGGSCTGCQGCCLGTLCVAGNSPGACGAGGETCGSCATGQQCVRGVCTAGPRCDGTTCSDGCCSAGQCVNPPTENQCGLGGAICTLCTGDEVCKQGRCDDSPPTGSFTVTVVSASVSADACSVAGTIVDDCDPYVEITFKDTLYTSGVQLNTAAPVWRADVFTASAADLRQNPLEVEVFDEDDLVTDDELGSCTIQPTDAQLNKGELIQDCGADTKSLKLTFTAK